MLVPYKFLNTVMQTGSQVCKAPSTIAIQLVHFSTYMTAKHTGGG